MAEFHSGDVAERWGRELYDSQLIQRYEEKLKYAQKHKQPWHIRTVADVFGERVYWMVHALMKLMGTEERSSSTVTALTDPDMQLLLANTISKSVPYLWTSDMWRLAQASPLPRHVIAAEQMPYPVMWFAFQKQEMYLDNETRFIQNMMLEDQPDGILVHYFVVPTKSAGVMQPNALPYVTGGMIRYGKVYPTDITDPIELEVATGLLSALSFVNSPCLRSIKEQVSEHDKKYFGLESSGVDEVHFIDLRSLQDPDRKKRKKKKMSDTPGVEWQFRWPVRGHHRAQWYPSLQAHKVKWIKPFTKGPEGKPFRVPVYKVMQ